MKLNSLLLLALLCFIFFSCSEKETPGGVKYTILKKGDGLEVASGKFLVMDLVLRDSKDSVWFDSQSTGYPAIIAAPDSSMIKDEGENGVFKLLTKGDCVTFQLPAETFFTKTRRMPVPKNMSADSKFSFVVNLKNVWSQEEVQSYQQEMAVAFQRKQNTTDSTIIANHLKEKNLEALSTPSGLRYIIQKQGKGDNAVPGKMTYVHYAGYLLDGTLFDTSLASVAKENNFNNGNRNEPYPVVVNQSSVIQGWHEILQLMNKGTKLRVYIPSTLAYGPRGNQPVIPPNAVLIFDMELADLK